MDVNEILKITDELNKKISKKEGGRANLALGTKPVNPFAPKPIKPLGDMKMAEFDLKDYMEEFERVFPEMIEKRGTQEYMDKLEDYFRGLASKDREGIMMAKDRDWETLFQIPPCNL